MVNKKFNKIVCQRILELRIEHRLTQEQLAYQSGISKGGLSEIERNMKEPKLYTIIKICTAMGISLLDFFDFNEIEEFRKTL